MRISIGCVDGQTYTSDPAPEQEINEALAANGGIIGTGPFRYIVFEDARDFISQFAEIIVKGKIEDFDLNIITLQLDGKSRHFKPEHIVWAEVDYDN